MANAAHHTPEEQPLEKVVWGYVGTAVLWITSCSRVLPLSGWALVRVFFLVSCPEKLGLYATR